MDTSTTNPRESFPLVRCVAWLCLVTLIYVASETKAPAQEVDSDSVYESGLLFTRGDLTQVVKHAFASDLRQAARWHGYVESDGAGEYQLAVRVTGEIAIRIAGEVRLQANSESSAWVVGKAFQLAYDHYPLDVSLAPLPGKEASVTVFWSGPGFGWEPLPQRTLWHRKSDASDALDLDAGESLYRALRCQACHDSGDASERGSLRAPTIEAMHPNLRHDWLVDFLTQDIEQPKSSPNDEIEGVWRSVHGRFSAKQAADLIAWMASIGEGPRKEHVPTITGNAEAGRNVMYTVGCLACHEHRDLGTGGLFAGGDLTDLGRKRSAGFVHRWLKDPNSVNPNHRMPEFDLSDQQTADVAAWLLPPSEADSESLSVATGSSAMGAKLAAEYKCRACHKAAADGSETAIRLSGKSNWQKSCLGSSSKEQPSYHAPKLRAQIEAYIRMGASKPQGDVLMEENNCLSCHARGDGLGISLSNQEVVDAHSDLTNELATMKPPGLNSVGDKLRTTVLKDSISRKQQPLRSWLSIRMPRFPMTDEQVHNIAEYLVAADRVPDPPKDVDVDALLADPGVAERFVTSDGFGCTSCHAVGKVQPPPGTPPGQLAPKLSMANQRIRKVWFDRWVRNPARISPKMEMPSVQVPIPNVLEGDLDRQLNAVWNILNVPGFSPPDPNPTRLVRHAGDLEQPAAVITDVFKLRGEKLIKPFLIGLPNRNNILLDLETGRMAAWWVGDTARQRTLGKTWYWEAPLLNVVRSSKLPDVMLFDGGKFVTPNARGQFVGELDEWKQVPAGVQIQYRLHFPTAETLKLQSVNVIQRITVNEQGWDRAIHADGLQAGQRLALRITSEKPAWLAVNEQVDGFVLSEPNSTRPAIHAEYEATNKGAQPIEAVVKTHPTAEQRVLAVMPGFRVTRLPLRTDVMPISIGWRPSGDMLLGSLKGRVWSVGDANGDGVLDRMRGISDDLAAPYGIHGESGYVDVVNKHAIIRLHDEDNDGTTDRHEVIASGWGHTDDYHDWVVGLPKDAEGNYYISIPCQQDDRSPAAAKWRGRVLRIEPRDKASHGTERKYRVKELTAGHRFPMGIARNRRGELFVTDNQGNYNPFNELNHVVAGRHFGFINKLERKAGVSPPSLTPPTINIPHPWTRSVNGICFLESPDPNRPQFGPFEGHLVGCEYDTRRLIRMSIDEVDGQLQGAAYPLAVAAEDAEDGLQGPVNCSIAPNGDLYVANIRDSGWGGGSNTGSVVRIQPDLDHLPAGIAEVNATEFGFLMKFTSPISRSLGSERANYKVESYRRISTPVYGGDDVDRRQEKLVAVVVDADGMSVELHLNQMRKGCVYEFKLSNLVEGESAFFPAEAYYTLHASPFDSQ